MNNMDWSQIRAFLEVCRHGSLSAAARALGLSQPTLSREIQSLEKSTQLNLFKRSPQGLHLTAEGQRLVEAARQMDEAADRFQLQVSGLSEALEGDVRISANEVVGIYMLPAAITAFRQQHPAVQVELVISNRASSLSKREADIALRMFRPSQPDLVARRLPDLALGFYAHETYLRHYGEPAGLEEFSQHCVIGLDADPEFIDEAAKLGIQFSPRDFAIRSDHYLAQIQLARAGAGIVGTHKGLAKHWPEMKQVMCWAALPDLPFWLVCHSDSQYNSRIRVLYEFLAQWFAEDPYRGVPHYL